MGEIPGLKTKSKTWAKIQCRLFASILTIITLMIDLPSVEGSPKAGPFQMKKFDLIGPQPDFPEELGYLILDP
jgi:hypothetical protein